MLARDHQAVPGRCDSELSDEAEDDAAEAEFNAKGGVSHEAMRAWILSWGTPGEIPKPLIGD